MKIKTSLVGSEVWKDVRKKHMRIRRCLCVMKSGSLTTPTYITAVRTPSPDAPLFFYPETSAF
jgi:hypothetical protein